MPHPLLYELNDVSYTYQALRAPPYTALQSVSLRVEKGEFVAIVGASGSGKSTLMHLLGLMSDPGSGNLSLSGELATRLSADEKSDRRNRSIGFLFQQFFLLPQLSVMENILLPAEYARTKTTSEQWTARAQALMKQFGLTEHAGKRPSQLSGGQCQRVALCRALIMKPDILMCDEPTGALDSATAAEVLDTLMSLNHQGHTIIVITHDPEVASRAQRIIQIADGAIISDQRNPARVGTRPGSDTQRSLAPPEIIRTSIWQSVISVIMASARLFFLPTLQALKSQRLRTVLTMTGLLLGVASVFIMLTLTGKVQDVFREFFETQGARKSFVSFDWRQAERTGAPRWQGLHVTADLPRINQQILKYGRLDPTVDTDGCAILSPEGNFQGSLTGVNSLREIEENALRIASGRTPLPHEFTMNPAPRIALLGSEAVDKLFPKTARSSAAGTSLILGQTVRVRGCAFEGTLKIVGILQPQDSLFNPEINSSLYVPTATLISGGAAVYNTRFVAVPNPDVNPTWFAKYIVNKLKIMTGNKYPLRFFSFEQELEKFNLMMGILLGLTLVIGGLCTLIGGIGVMNIMLVNVHERIQEIGIRKAVGARNRDVRRQFLLESVGLCFISGLLGILFGIAVSSVGLQIAKSVLPRAVSLTFAVDPYALVSALLVSLGAGLVFGTWPARRAAELQIVDALKQE
jgi:macrolide transport system ATP-binding/permease protein